MALRSRPCRPPADALVASEAWLRWHDAVTATGVRRATAVRGGVWRWRSRGEQGRWCEPHPTESDSRS